MKKTLLILEDDKSMQEILSFILIKEGYEILLADNVSTALEIIDFTIPDLIISDYNLPDITGIEFLSYIRNESNIADVPFIILSADIISGNLKASFENLGVKYCLEKPIKKDKLLCALNDSLNLISTDTSNYNEYILF